MTQELGTQLGLDFETPRLVKVTPNRLATWDDCPRRYRMTYLDRPSPPRGGAWAHATLGAVVHLALRAWFDLAPVDRTPDRAAALVDRHWTSEGFRDAEQARQYRERARGWLAAYEWPADEPVAVEKWVSVATDRIVAEGRVDRVDRRGPDAVDPGAHDGADELVVVDYKTGREPAAGDARESRALALYAVATAHTLRRTCRRVELHHVPTGRVAGWTHDDASLRGHVRAAERTATELAGAADALAAGGAAEALFPPRPAARCATCDVRRHCPEGRAAAPERESWALLAP